MNATVPERAPEEIEKTAAQTNEAKVEASAAADEPAPGESGAAEQQETPAEPDAAAADGTAEQAELAAAPDPADEPATEEVRAADEPPMAWHRFLTNFWLWLAAIGHGVQAGWILWGGQYYTAEIRNLAYAGLPGLRMLDWALAGAAGAAAALCALSAVKLRKRRSSGPRLLCGAYILLLAGQIGLAAGRWFIIGLTPLSASTLGSMAVYLALLLVNGSYYRRRREGFAPRG